MNILIENECICEFCSMLISNKYNLQKHQKTKRCQTKQEEYKKDEIQQLKIKKSDTPTLHGKKE